MSIRNSAAYLDGNKYGAGRQVLEEGDDFNDNRKSIQAR